MAIKNSKNFLLFAVISVFTVLILQKTSYEPHIKRPQSDAFWYIDYALTLKERNTFGYSKTDYQPSNVIAPLYPFYLSLLLRLDENLSNDFKCLLENRTNNNCDFDLSFLAWGQCVFIIIMLWSLWLTVYNISHSNELAWLSSSIPLLMGRPLEYANLVLTEAMMITLFSLLTLFLIKLFHTRKNTWLILFSISIACLTLTRPQFHYLFLSIAICFLIACIIYRRKKLFLSLFIMILSYFLIVGPWMGRNYYHFNEPSLTSGYGDRVLATRISYNQMSWKEWGVSFIYWFPDMGDSIARKLFGAESYEKLTFDSGSYYTEYRDVLSQEKWKWPTKDIVSYLVRTEIFGNIFKHSATTLPLSWRGIFIAKYWGVFGIICFIVIMSKKESEYKYKLLVISIPAFFMVLFHAFISLNIPRYNLFLIPLYSISIAILVADQGQKIRKLFLLMNKNN